MKKLLLGFLFSLILFVFVTPLSKTYASEYFSRDYGVLYTVKENGTTQVSINVSLTNKTSDYYPSSDTLQVGFESIANVVASDPDGELQPRITKTDSGNQIELNFKKKVVGKDKSLTFNVTFDTPDIARHEGKIWEINIPGIANPDEFISFNAEVRVPEPFGPPSYIKPVQTDNKLLFSKDQLGESGISIAYGTEQLYSFNLVYHLQNKNVFPIRTEIALPPTTNYQEVSIDDISPRPENVTIDKDGNWLAEYILTSSQKFDVTVRGRVAVTRTPKKESLNPTDFELYTKERQYWQTSNNQIKKLAQELKTPEEIYKYVVDTLNYDFERVTQTQTRYGAIKTLQNPDSAVCLEFTDLFIAIARAAGIPAREVNGYAYTQNQKQRPLSRVQDILHSWPEYYDTQKQTWVMIDPTWGNTTGGTDYFNVFDYDHIVFVRKGLDSLYPIPAGGYKFSGDEQKKDVNITFSDSFPTQDAQLKLVPQMPPTFLGGLAITGTMKATNISGVVSQPQSATITSKSLSPSTQMVTIPALPPYGSKDISFTFKKTPFFSNQKHSFTFQVGDTIIRQEISVVPFMITQRQLIGGVLSVVLTIILFIIAIKTRRIYLSRRKR